MPTGIFGKPLRAIYRFSHQNAQTLPSPLVGEGGRGIGGKGLPPLPTTQDATAIRSQPPQSASTAMPALSRAPLSSTAPADTPG